MRSLVKIFNNRGFTLVEIMVALAVVAGVSTVIMQTTKETNKTSVKFQTDVEATEIANDIMSELANPATCAANLGGKSISGLPGTVSAGITSITKKTGAVTYSTANADGYGPSRLVISNYNFVDLAGALDDVDAFSADRTMYLLISFNKKNIVKGSSAASSTFTRKVKISFETNTNNTGTSIAFCRAVSTGLDAIWQRNPSMTSEIFYNQGFVGIGIGDPEYLLHVSNSSTASNDVTAMFMQPNQPANSSQTIKFGRDNTTNYNSANISFYYDTTTTNNRLDLSLQGLSTPLLSLTAGNKVGVSQTSPSASLDVNGGIRAKGGGPGAGGVSNQGYAFNSPGDTDSGLFSSADGQLEFYTNNAERMRIDSAGNVGINTTTPAYTLDVNGNAALRGDLYTGASTGVSAIELGQFKTSDSAAQINLHARSGSAYDLLILRNAGANGAAQITNIGTGNFTIGANNGTALTIDSSNNITTTSRVIIDPSTYPNSSSDGLSGALGIYSNDAATKKWVQRQMNDVLSSATAQTLNSVTASLAAYQGSNLTAILKEAVCQTTYVQTNSVNYPGSYSGGTCTYTIPNIPPNCTVSGNCSALYATNMYATTVWANSFCANGSSACLTRTDRLKCPNGYLMYGLANGYPLCKAWGVSTPAIPTDTTTPVNF